MIVSKHINTRWTPVYIFVTAFFCFLFLEGAHAAERSLIIGFHGKPGVHEKDLIRKSRGRIRRSYNRIRAMSVTLDDKEIEKIMRDSNVAYIEEDAVIRVVDPLISQEYIDSWGVNHIGAEKAHESGNTGMGVKIAVLDTGIDYLHDDLKDNYEGGYDFVFNDDDPYDDSVTSHGTHLAGIIAARRNDSGVVGVAPDADIYAVKVLDSAGFGLLSWLIAGIEWSIENGMDIINLSLEGMDFQSLRDACDSAYSAGILIIAAGGNTGGGDVLYPAAYDSVIAVGGTDATDMEAAFSPIGPQVELAAPGVAILSTIANGGYNTISGTSQAAAHVTGTAALFYASGPEDRNGDNIIDNLDIRFMLQSTALDLGVEGRDEVFGFGLVDASVASFSEFEPIYMKLVRTYSFPIHDMQKVSLSGGIYEVNIENHGLKGIRMSVYEGDILQKKYLLHNRIYRLHTRNRRFSRIEPDRMETITIDAKETEYDIYFTPYGRTGTSADVIITEMPE